MKISEGVEFVDKIVPFKDLTLGTVLFLSTVREKRLVPSYYLPVHLVGFDVDPMYKFRLIIRINGSDERVYPDMLCFDMPT